MEPAERKELEALAKEIRKLTIDEIGFLGVGHIGGSMSIVDALAVVYHRHLRYDPKNPTKADRDRFVLSKGHAGPALYAMLAHKGFFPLEWLHTLNKGGTNLPSHADRTKTPGVDMSTGSLGQGFSAACGIALGQRMDGNGTRTYCIIGHVPPPWPPWPLSPGARAPQAEWACSTSRGISNRVDCSQASRTTGGAMPSS